METSLPPYAVRNVNWFLLAQLKKDFLRDDLAEAEPNLLDWLDALARYGVLGASEAYAHACAGVVAHVRGHR